DPWLAARSAQYSVGMRLPSALPDGLRALCLRGAALEPGDCPIRRPTGRLPSLRSTLYGDGPADTGGARGALRCRLCASIGRKDRRMSVGPLSGAATSAGGAPATKSAFAPVLEALHLRKYFPVRQFRLRGASPVVHAVEDTSLALVPGRALALVGESCSGKTTVARMLARLYEPTSGSILFQGNSITGSRRGALLAYRRHVQLIFQDPFASLSPVHDVRYHLARPLQLHGHARSRREETAQILGLLEKVNLIPAEQFITKYPHQLSGGQRQRVAIARALAVRPEVLLADEPVSMLDVSIRLDVLNLLLALKEEERLAVLFITHDIASARYFAENTLVMYAG